MVNVYQVNAIARQLAHDVQVVAKEQAVRASGEQGAEFGVFLVVG